jgi:hypothetical protein
MIMLFILMSKAGSFYGKKHTDESKRKISEARSNKKNPNMARDVQGANNPFHGNTHTNETKSSMGMSKSGSDNPMYGKEKSFQFNYYMTETNFPSGSDNPSYKGTYVLDVDANLQYGPYLKADVLSTYHISSKKYYPILNQDVAYKGYKYSHKK